MFKGMRKAIIPVCLLVLSVAPAVYASDAGSEARPWISISSILSDIFDGFQQAFDEMLTAFDRSEAETSESPPPGSEDGAAQAASSEPPPTPPNPENDDDDGNIGGGQEPWG